MIDSTRQQILRHMIRLAELEPDVRFGQLVSWIACTARPDDPQATPNIDDDEFLHACEEHLENMEQFMAARRESQVETKNAGHSMR
jgi:hypothetical protein